LTDKIQALIDAQPAPFEYGDIFARESVAGVERLVIGVNGSQAECVQLLARELLGPFQLLYVLHTSRTNAELGRYESPELDSQAVERFLRTFGRFLSEDSRHDFWVRSHGDDATIVLDRHNLIYAYGPLDTFESVLSSLGARAGDAPETPVPHSHHYHREWDGSERAVLRALRWSVKPLTQSDVQRVVDG